MSLFKITLDGNILSDEPEGWQDFISELKRDKEIRGQVLLMDLTLRFKGGTDGYNHLKPLIDCQGFCAFSTLSIDEDCNQDGNWVEIFDGLIFYTEIREFLFPCILECKLTDNSFYAKINNNKNIEAYINVGRSKNDVTISQASQTPVQMFDVTTGVYSSSVIVWRVWWCFRFIIQYMTDGEMEFVSDYFGTGGAGEGVAISVGERIRIPVGGGATKAPLISFKKLFDEVNKKVRIAFSIETIAGVKTMRIEPESYFFNTGVSTTLNNVKGIIKSVNTSELYSKLQIGSSETLEYVTGQTDFPNNIAFVGFQEESFTITGKCNINNTLNLVSDWIIDSNIIQDIFTNGNNGYDEDICFLTFDPNTLQAIQTDVFNTGAPPYFYNNFFRNSEVAVRWFGGVPNSIALYLGPEAASDFLATKTSNVIISGSNSPFFEPVIFQDDVNPPNFDSGNNYIPATSEYQIPTNGLYTFSTRLTGTCFMHGFSQPLRFRAYLHEYDSAGFAGGNLLNIYDIFDLTIPLSGSFVNTIYDIAGSVYINGTAGNKVLVALNIFPTLSATDVVDASIEPGSTFACTSSETGGGIYQVYNPEDFKAYQYEFEYPLTFAQYQTIIANPLKLLAFNDGANDYSGWIEKMQYPHGVTGKTKFLLSKSLSKTLCE